ncbi:hypothetical protein HAP47_0021810 [Bradyrhizobium sp. 41S5]|uniref:AbiJ-NTD4 domain-containing protein n=1 Tax=Bradyrhizobium sp. 41S5 TaxID=1404443 RepID=UPI00156B1FE3|nr:hypothetical protein [Bradyrhizobium sp. 41S5]UFX41936.1 hypothetical protein HAP47_0021810 [Bradyrhizobium sp. 41S5]
MLTDIFAERYRQTQLWGTFTQTERRLLVQMFRIFSEQVCPFNAHDDNKKFWSDVQSRLSMEFGCVSLSPLSYNFMGQFNGKPHHYYGDFTMDDVCQTWFLKEFDGTESTDRFVKERVSFIELAFRLSENRIAIANANLPSAIKFAKDFDFSSGARPPRSIRVPGSYEDGIRSANEKMNKAFREAVDELNARFRQAECKLNYHNGFVQIATDEFTQNEIEKPFWRLVDSPKWKNVDTDMKEAFDRRDNSARDPAFYAVRALESAIKIISDDKGWTHGKEKGAHNYIDNLSSKGFITAWEASGLKHLFTSVRNPLGHGPGSAEMPTLTVEQTDWAIDTSLGWVKRLVRSS